MLLLYLKVGDKNRDDRCQCVLMDADYAVGT